MNQRRPLGPYDIQQLRDAEKRRRAENPPPPGMERGKLTLYSAGLWVPFWDEARRLGLDSDAVRHYFGAGDAGSLAPWAASEARRTGKGIDVVIREMTGKLSDLAQSLKEEPG